MLHQPAAHPYNRQSKNGTVRIRSSAAAAAAKLLPAEEADVVEIE